MIHLLVPLLTQGAAPAFRSATACACVGGAIVRLGLRSHEGPAGRLWGPGLAARLGALPGETSLFQVWYRDPGGSPCGSQFNLTNAIAVDWEP